MRNFRFYSFIPSLLTVLSLSVTVRASAISTDSTKDVPAKETKRYIVSLADDASPDNFCARRGFRMRKQERNSPNGFARKLASDEALILPGFNMVICSMSSEEAKAARGEKGVLTVEEDGPVTLLGQASPSALVRLGIDRFPIAHINGKPKQLDVGVAVLDSGIDPHPDLNFYQWYSPFSLTPDDDVGHGTAIAGVIAATDNEIGVVGAAPGVRIWNIKCVGQPPNNSWTHVLAGLTYIYRHSNDIAVVNLSIGNKDNNAPVEALGNIIKALVHVGVVVVASAGNNATDLAGPDGIYGTVDDQVPASIPVTMAVSATDDSTDTMWSESNSLGSNFNQTDLNANPSYYQPIPAYGSISVGDDYEVYTNASGSYYTNASKWFADFVGVEYSPGYLQSTSYYNFYPPVHSPGGGLTWRRPALMSF